MQLVKFITIVALAAIGAEAGRPSRPVRPPPPPPVIQQISCSSGDAYCCAPSENAGSTCSKLAGSNVSCNSLIVCCNNNDGAQTCSANLQQPIQFVGL